MAKFASTQLFFTTDDGYGVRINSFFLNTGLASGRNTWLACVLLRLSLKDIETHTKRQNSIFYSYLRTGSHTKPNIFSISLGCLLSELVQIIQEVTWKLNCLLNVLTHSKQYMLIWYFQKMKFFFSCLSYARDTVQIQSYEIPQDRILESNWILPIHVVI